MLARLAITALLLASVAACDPKPAELDDAPSTSAAEAPVVPGELAGATPAQQQILLPGVMNIAAPLDSHIVNSCEQTVAAGYDYPPAMACVAVLRDTPLPSEFDRLLDYNMATAGWTYIRSVGAQHYFESARPNSDCASLAVFSDLDPAQLDRLLASSNLAAPPAEKSWRGYAIPATIREACGADRMKP